MNPADGVELRNRSATAGLADVISRVARDPGVKDALGMAARSVGGAIADAWRRNDGTGVLIAALQATIGQARR